jgi:hypothetical protein
MAKIGADGERYNPRGWVTRENNLIIKKSSPRPAGYQYNSGPMVQAAIRDLAGLLDESDLACAVFERLAGG